MKKIKKFFSEVGKELLKVKFPSKKNMVKYSVSTIGFVIFFALFFQCIIIVMGLVESLV